MEIQALSYILMMIQPKFYIKETSEIVILVLVQEQEQEPVTETAITVQLMELVMVMATATLLLQLVVEMALVLDQGLVITMEIAAQEAVMETVTVMETQY